MKALVLYEPWASLMAIEAKRNETRGRPWIYDGDVAICAAKHKLGEDVPEAYMRALSRLWDFKDRFEGGPFKSVRDLYYSLPFGRVVCVVEKFGCISTNDDNGDDRSLTGLELQLGDYGANRFYYPTRNCRRLKRPVAVVGRQFVFDLPEKIVAEVAAQI